MGRSSKLSQKKEKGADHGEMGDGELENRGDRRVYNSSEFSPSLQVIHTFQLRFIYSSPGVERLDINIPYNP